MAFDRPVERVSADVVKDLDLARDRRPSRFTPVLIFTTAPYRLPVRNTSSRVNTHCTGRRALRASSATTGSMPRVVLAAVTAAENGTMTRT